MGSQPKKAISITKTRGRASQPAARKGKSFIRHTIKVASNLGHLIGQRVSKLMMANYFHYLLPNGEGEPPGSGAGEWGWEVTGQLTGDPNNGSREEAGKRKERAAPLQGLLAKPPSAPCTVEEGGYPAVGKQGWPDPNKASPWSLWSA